MSLSDVYTAANQQVPLPCSLLDAAEIVMTSSEEPVLQSHHTSWPHISRVTWLHADRGASSLQAYKAKLAQCDFTSYDKQCFQFAALIFHSLTCTDLDRARVCRRAFSIAGPTVWNSLPDFIRDPSISSDCFRRLLKTYLFARY